MLLPSISDALRPTFTVILRNDHTTTRGSTIRPLSNSKIKQIRARLFRGMTPACTGFFHYTEPYHSMHHQT